MNDHYRIRILGPLDPSWSGRLGGLSIVQDPENDPPVTTLTGELADQSALTGVINALVNMRLTVLSVERIAPGPGVDASESQHEARS